jgi:hypothetical protein
LQRHVDQLLVLVSLSTELNSLTTPSYRSWPRFTWSTYHNPQILITLCHNRDIDDRFTFTPYLPQALRPPCPTKRNRRQNPHLNFRERTEGRVSIKQLSPSHAEVSSEWPAIVSVHDFQPYVLDLLGHESTVFVWRRRSCAYCPNPRCLHPQSSTFITHTPWILRNAKTILTLQSNIW